MVHYFPAFLCALTLIVFSAGVARADAIDGDWCSTDARHFAIQGPRITTPGGAEINGDYDRHGFAYVVPEGEQDAGARVIMDLISDDVLHLLVLGQTDEVQGEMEVWRRCQITS